MKTPEIKIKKIGFSRKGWAKTNASRQVRKANKKATQETN